MVPGAVADTTINAWDTPNKRRQLLTPGGVGRYGVGAGGGGGGGPAADSPGHDVSPLWGKPEGASPALSAISREFSPYHVESATLHTPGGGRRGRRGLEETREEFMDISSAARDLRELSQITIDDKVGAGGARVPSSADVGRARSGGLKAGRGKGKRVCCLLELYIYIYTYFPTWIVLRACIFASLWTLILVLHPGNTSFVVDDPFLFLIRPYPVIPQVSPAPRSGARTKPPRIACSATKAHLCAASHPRTT